MFNIKFLCNLAFCVAFIIIVCACKKNNEEVKQTIYNYDKSLTLQIDSLTIKLDSSFSSLYQDYHTLCTEDTILFYGYNRSNHTIDIFNINLLSTKIRRKVKLHREGPNGVANVNSFFICSPDSIFCSDDYSIYLLTGEGNLLKKWSLALDFPDFFKKYWINPTNEHPIIYDRQTKSIYLYIVDYEIGYDSPKYKDRYAKPILARFNLENNKLITLPIFYPKEYTLNYKGYLDRVSMTPSFDKTGNLEKLYFTFGAVSHLAYYDLKHEVYVVKGGASTITENEAENLAWSDVTKEDKKMKHTIYDIGFMQTTFTTNSHLGFRFHFGRLPQSVLNLKNSLIKKPLILTVFNNKHEIIKEIDFPIRNIERQFCFVQKETLYVPFFANKNEDEIKFLTIHLK